ncbi:MAG: NAD(P)-dependent oxidoreductase [Betaproteobacteria bacterium]
MVRLPFAPRGAPAALAAAPADEKASVVALASGSIAGAGLDVFEQQPTPDDNPLLQMDNVVVTPHAICFTDECMRSLAESAFRAVIDVAQGRNQAMSQGDTGH